MNVKFSGVFVVVIEVVVPIGAASGDASATAAPITKEKTRNMEMDQGKLFIGGISWDTNEDRLKEYFGAYGEVAEAVIMRDRTTGRARGFGFVVFANPSDAEKVVKEKHMIDGRTVEAKKAVPRDDHHLINRNSSSTQGSPVPGRTKKIFVGGLASTVTEADFKAYFDQFGTITDVVVMYDHNTQRPRGFGFITFDSEDAVDHVLHKTFHELNGKTVEVKRAVPKELSPVPTRSPLSGYNYGFGRAGAFLGNYNMGSIGGYGVRMDGRYSPLASRTSFSHFNSPAYGANVNVEQDLGNSGSLGYSRVLSPYYGSSQGRYNTPIGYNTSGSRGDSFLSSPSRNMWGSGLNNSGSGNNVGSASYFGSGSSGFGVFGSNGANWGTSPIAPSVGGGSFGNRGGENSSYGQLAMGGFQRNTAPGRASSFAAGSSGGVYEGSYGEFYRGGSVYGDATWRNASAELDDNSGSFRYGLVGGSEDVGGKDSEDFVVGYDVANRQSSRGNVLAVVILLCTAILLVISEI
ncbi:RNA-binding (RRM/RBD/RNP motifs) family protein [Striga asiatica]|uniref:RNA-binding (RRM/RBD/RNP motifs) family protein n=1 Tax=Striga asiatica TaxID=4170 RepID=A0A5A7PIH6_STRAF|nr:RNA-binding (RRM/RBD/RNP motifs) family protein [Striga asiatica]